MTRRLLALTLAACGPSSNPATSSGTSDAASTSADTTTADTTSADTTSADTTTGPPTTDTPTTGTPTTGITGTSADGCPDHAAADDCCCFVPLDEEPYFDVQCPSERLCAPIFCGEDDPDCLMVEDAAVDCIFTALQGDNPGSVGWSQTPLIGWQHDVDVYVTGTGDLFWLGVEYTGDPVYFEGVRRFSAAALNPVCTTLPTANDRFACLRNAFTAPAAICLQPHSE